MSGDEEQVAWVELGNAHAVEGQRLRGEDRLYFRPVAGKQVTTIRFPEGTLLSEAMHTTVAQIRYHFQEDTGPEWVDSDSTHLKRLLSQYFGLNPDHERPAHWEAS